WYAIYTIIVGVVYFKVYHLTINTQCFINLAVTFRVCSGSVLAMEQGLWPVSAVICVMASIVCLRFTYRTWKH
ncbi:MAG: hypothetical protein IKT03_07035, partial [Muribaculaceae bacterium]|nr:hypothetical protein [Muribaculaceae bacterium]